MSIWCSATVEGWYVGRLAKSMLEYSSVSWCMYCIFLVIILAAHVYNPAEHSMS